MKRRTFGASLMAGVSSLFVSKEVVASSVVDPHDPTVIQFADIVLSSLSGVASTRYVDHAAMGGDIEEVVRPDFSKMDRRAKESKDPNRLTNEEAVCIRSEYEEALKNATRRIVLEHYSVSFTRTEHLQSGELSLANFGYKKTLEDATAKRPFHVEIAEEIGRLFHELIADRECVICRLPMIPSEHRVDCAVVISPVASVRVCQAPNFLKRAVEYSSGDQLPVERVVVVDMIIGFFDKEKQEAE